MAQLQNLEGKQLDQIVSPATRKTGFASHESFFWHDTGNGALFLLPGDYVQGYGYAENPETKRRFKNLMERSGLYDELTLIKPVPATPEQIGYFHTPEYIDRVKEMSKVGGGDAGELAIVGKGTYEIALLAAGAAITAVDAVVKGEVDNAYALSRPPGHHATFDKGIGFCIFNNAVIAAEYARKELGLERVMILDWDVHHGNGTEDAFYEDEGVLFVSVHQEGLFPEGRGFIEHTGKGKGEGTTINLPLVMGSGDGAYIAAFKEVIQPLAADFKPELIIISAGQDCSIFDPLGRQAVSADGFKQLTDIVMDMAAENCDGKVVVIHEGGYSAEYVPFCSHRIVEGLSGAVTQVEDPFIGTFNGVPYKEVTNDQRARIDEIKAQHGLK